MSSFLKKLKTNTFPVDFLSQDCLQKVLSFGTPPEVWGHRLTSSAWRRAARAALFRVDAAAITADDGKDIHRSVANICPNLTCVYNGPGLFRSFADPATTFDLPKVCFIVFLGLLTVPIFFFTQPPNTISRVNGHFCIRLAFVRSRPLPQAHKNSLDGFECKSGRPISRDDWLYRITKDKR